MKGCIFDLDGVLVDTAGYHYRAWKRLANMLGFEFTEKQNERLKGVSRMDSLDILLEIGNLKLDRKKKEEYAELKNVWYVEYIRTMGPGDTLPGVEAFLEELRSRGYRTAVGSSSKNAPLILKNTHLSRYLDATVDGNDISKAKPDPEIFLLGAKRLGLAPGECAVFEDAEAGIEAANRAGMFSIGVGSPDVLTKADTVIAGLHEYTVDRLEQDTAARRS
ncbi:MAG: beta-phosphoglucomutase [Spirochaetota bacterium]